MFENIVNGFKTANATRKLVFGDKELFAYPVASVILSIIFAALILGSLFFMLLIGALSGLSGAALVVIVIIVLYLLYLVVFFIGTYFTMAMLIAFREYAKGTKQKISFSESLRRTAPYLKLIIEWSLFYTAIATLLHIIEGAINRLGGRYGISGFIVSRLITGAMNLALAAAVAFSLPVIIDEKTGPITTIKTSTKFIISNFGETFGGLIFTEIFGILIAIVGVVFIIAGAYVFFATGAVVAVAAILAIIGVILVIFGVVLRYVLFNCFKLILYDYKTRKTMPKGFDSKLLDSSVKKKSKGNKPSGINPLSFGMGQQGGL